MFGDLGEDDLALELCRNLRNLDRSRVPGVLRDHLTYRLVERTAAE
ncbi:MAG: hypothetical protein M3O32_04205 [Actinomycetota bacterium]|nr:hypothetical protein [Actinomycetota bacterium]